jgi:tetratricopeptide (TPR) repeat protein
MSSKRRRPSEKVAIVPPGGKVVAAGLEDRPEPRRRLRWWIVLAAAVVALALGFEIYGPSLSGEFLFDDEYLPFLMPDVQQAPLRAWLGVRPVLMISYWLNYRQSELEPWSYHAVNVVFHALNAVLAWLIVRRLLGKVGESGAFREVLAGFSGALFLLHPLQTESVAYVASRSETLSVFFFLAAYAVYLYSPAEKISVRRTVAVLALFLVACTVKEHTTVLPGLLLLTDYFFTTPFRFEGIRQRLRLYVPIVLAGGIGLFAVVRVLSTAQTAGFGVHEFTWYQYLLTQFRVIPTYVRLYVLPFNLNGDYEFAISRSPLEYGAVLWLAVLVAISVAAWKYRREYPLAAFGWFGFLLLLAPTSSVIPIRDVIAERRVYLPFICLLLMTVGFLRRIRVQPLMLASALALVLVVASFATHRRSGVWATALAFWTDTAAKSPGNARAQFQLAYAQWKEGRCAEAVENYGKVAKLEKPDDRLLVDWALALDCVDKPDEAVAKLRQAAAIAPSALIYAQIGMVYGKRNRFDEATVALNEAEKLDSRFEMTYVYRGNIHAAKGEYARAADWYRHALAMNPRNETARNALAVAEQNVGKAR